MNLLPREGLWSKTFASTWRGPPINGAYIPPDYVFQIANCTAMEQRQDCNSFNRVSHGIRGIVRVEKTSLNRNSGPDGPESMFYRLLRPQSGAEPYLYFYRRNTSYKYRVRRLQNWR